MKIFVVGGAGYIGSVCAELLLNEGHEVAIFDNLSEGHRAAVDFRTHFIEGELADRQAIQTALSSHRPNAVMHFAANALVGESMQNPSKYFRNNICNGLNLLDAMVAADVRHIVFSSTCAIFGPPDRLPIDETAQPHPISPYGESKLAFEKILHWYNEIHGLKFVCLRYFNVFGPRQRASSPYSGVISIFIECIRAGKKPVIYGFQWRAISRGLSSPPLFPNRQASASS